MVDGNLDANPLNKCLENFVHLLGPRKFILNPCSIFIHARLLVTSAKHLPTWITWVSFISQCICGYEHFKENKNLAEPSPKTQRQHKWRHYNFRRPDFLWKKGLLSFPIGPTFLVCSKWSLDKFLWKTWFPYSPVTPSQLGIRHLGGERMCNASKAPSVTEAFGLRMCLHWLGYSVNAKKIFCVFFFFKGFLHLTHQYFSVWESKS